MASISPSEQHIADIRHEIARLNAHLDLLTIKWHLASMKKALEMI